MTVLWCDASEDFQRSGLTQDPALSESELVYADGPFVIGASDEYVDGAHDSHP